MKKNILVLFCLILAAQNLMAQDSELTMDAPTNSYRVGLNVEPLWTVLGGLGAKVDVALTRRIALGIGGMYIPERRSLSSSSSSSSSYSTTNDYKWSYSEVYVGPTFMLTGDLSTHGLYLTPAVGYVQARISEYSSSNLQGSLGAPEIRTTVGYQWRVGGFRFAVGGGLKYLQTNDIIIRNSSGQELSREKGSSLGGLALDGQIGYVF